MIDDRTKSISSSLKESTTMNELGMVGLHAQGIKIYHLASAKGPRFHLAITKYLDG